MKKAQTGTRYCTQCGVKNLVTEFNGRHTKCKKCIAKRVKEKKLRELGVEGLERLKEELTLSLATIEAILTGEEEEQEEEPQ